MHGRDRAYSRNLARSQIDMRSMSDSSIIELAARIHKSQKQWHKRGYNDLSSKLVSSIASDDSTVHKQASDACQAAVPMPRNFDY